MGENKEGGEQPNIQSEEASLISLRPQDMSISRDEEDSRHLLTEDQFDRLCALGGDLSLEFSLGLFGAGVGFVQNVIVTLAALYEGTPTTGLDVVLSMVCVGCLAGAAAKYSEHRKNRPDAEKLREKIRNRPKVRIRT